MRLKFILILVTALSAQWGMSTGGEDPNVREKRHYDGASSSAAIWAYVISSLFAFCLCCVPCVILGIVGCVAICVAGNVENNSRKASRLYSTFESHPDSQNSCRLQSYAYPQNAAESHLVKAVNENDSIDT